MKHKIAACKIPMIGEQCIVLGHCRYDDEEQIWELKQFFTFENYAGNPQFDQSAIDRRRKYWGNKIQFNAISQPLAVEWQDHSFDLGKAEAVEITKQEWEQLSGELSENEWMMFDDETWGK